MFENPPPTVEESLYVLLLYPPPINELVQLETSIVLAKLLPSIVRLINSLLLDKSKELFNTKSFYRVEQVGNTINKYNELVLEYLFEGYGEYHRFDIRFEIMYLTDIKRLVLSGSVEQGIHDLFDVIIHESILPDFVKTYNLKEYNYFDFNKYNG